MASDISSGLRGSAKIPPLNVILPAERVKIMDEGTKDQVLDLLSGLIAESAEVSAPQKKLKSAVLAREKLMSTGIGLGLAFPHVRMAEAASITAAAVLVQKGIAGYSSLDSKPVYLAVMIIAPEGQHAQHLRLLSLISSKLKDMDLSKDLFACSGEKQLWKLLVD